MVFVGIAGIAALIYLLVYCHAPASTLKTVVKTLSVAALVLAAWWGGGPIWLILALSLCAAGDYFLSRDTEATFLAGVGAFALGHLAYVQLFLGTPGTAFSVLTQPLAFIFVIMLVGYGVGMMTQLFRRAGDLRYAVMVYVPIIIAMGITAFCVPHVGALWLVLPAAILFMISDSVLAAELFLIRDDQPLRRTTPYVIWAFYWLAQLGFYLAYTHPTIA